jgi:tripartite-type tricarboxylate transporter receptor subunit TctC
LKHKRKSKNIYPIEEEEDMKTKRSGKLVTTCFLCALMFLGGSCWTAVHAAGSDYPNKPITLVVPLAVGGLADVGARILADAMEKQLKQPVVVVNKTGGGTTVGGYAVASAKPDGYTLGYGIQAGAAVMPEVYNFFISAPYSAKDLRTICTVNSFVMGITVKGDAPWNNMKDLMEYARKNPGQLKFAHNGKGGPQYMIMSTIAKAENVRLVDVPYDGDGASIPAVVGGHVPVALPAYALVKQLAEAKKVKVLAVTSDKKIDPASPPALGELGYRLPIYALPMGLFGPRSLPDAIVNKIDDTVRKIAEDKDFAAKNKSADLMMEYRTTAAAEKYLGQFRDDLIAFFKEEGFVKK